MKFGRCIDSSVVTVYAVNDTGTIYNALRKFGTLECVRCMGGNVVNGVRSNEVRLYLILQRLSFTHSEHHRLLLRKLNPSILGKEFPFVTVAWNE